MGAVSRPTLSWLTASWCSHIMNTSAGTKPSFITSIQRVTIRRLGVVLAIALFATACGSASDEAAVTVADAAPTAAAAPTDEPAPTQAPAPTEEPTDTDNAGTDNADTDNDGVAQSIEDVQAATVKILAEGSFVNPGEDARNSKAGIGTGFIISSDGLVVTNNHVVTGAALLQVYLAGEDKPVNARVLGVSECNDLAVIDLAGDGYPVLEFREGDITAGLEIYAAGYPVTDAIGIEAIDYTLTRGIVSTATADGETQWASVDSVIEHDARIRGGNSGGPLVDVNGQVVAINYAGNDEDQSYAIGVDQAVPVIEQLKNGDVESIGINGEALFSPDGTPGIWVASVDSGSPADRTGIAPGDFLVNMEGLPLATDGTMKDYCDIIRTNGPDDVMSIEVVRPTTEEYLVGQINGDELAVSFSFAQELADDAGAAAEGYAEYVFVSDDSGSVGVEVPTAWSDTNGEFNEQFGESIWASPNLEAFNDGWDVPGIIVENSSQFGPGDLDSILDSINYEACTYGGREAFTTDDEVFTGQWDLYTDCGGAGSMVVVLAATPPAQTSVVRMLVQIVDDRDLEALDRALASFDVFS